MIARYLNKALSWIEVVFVWIAILFMRIVNSLLVAIILVIQFIEGEE